MAPKPSGGVRARLGIVLRLGGFEPLTGRRPAPHDRGMKSRVYPTYKKERRSDSGLS